MVTELVFGILAVAAIMVGLVLLVRKLEASSSPVVQDISEVIEKTADIVDPSSTPPKTGA